ncbi:MAG: response regulator [Bacteroidales bacterium]|nr:response regulator [Bacteroidales bacterium]
MYQIFCGKTALIVEDEESNWFLIRDILQSYQMKTVWADVGQKAIDWVAEGKKFDIILMDIHLPTMDGMEVTRRLKEMGSKIPVVAQTAFALNEEIEKCYNAGCVAHVCKPFTVAEITTVVKNVLEQH